MEDLSEKEQLDQMRAWWSEYGNFVVGGIVIGIAIMVGISQYSSSNKATQTEASVIYESVAEAVADGKLEDAETSAQELFADYTSTIYPSQARLAIARLYMDRGRDQDAADALRAVVDSDGDSQLGLIGRLRLAKVLLYQNKPQEVVDLLADAAESAYTSRFSEALGDAYVMLADFAAAEEAYLRAMSDSTTMPTIDRTLVQMKIDDLPDTAAAAVTEPESDAAPSMDGDDAAGDESEQTGEESSSAAEVEESE